eukprot:7117843-Lingulodinium_polyedra.AAC.1
MATVAWDQRVSCKRETVSTNALQDLLLATGPCLVRFDNPINAPGGDAPPVGGAPLRQNSSRL